MADPITKEKHRASTISAQNREDVKNKLIIARTGTQWINNGQRTCRVKLINGLPDGWVFGRINSCSRPPSSAGTKWINNGKINKQLKYNQELPDGWLFGMLSQKDNLK